MDEEIRGLLQEEIKSEIAENKTIKLRNSY